MAIDSGRKGEFEARDEVRRLRNLIPQLMIASQREADMDGRTYQDKTTYPKETEGQKLEKKGGYIDTGELDSGGKPLMIQGMPDAIDPKEHKRQQKQKKIRGIAEEGATEGERQAGRGKLKDQTQLPNFLKTIIDAKPSPADLLKILQFLPALTGGGLGQMADSSAGSKVLNELPRGGWPSRNSHRGLVENDKLLETIRRATEAFKA